MTNDFAFPKESCGVVTLRAARCTRHHESFDPRRKNTMKIREIMTRDVRVASPDDTLQLAAQLMEKDDFGALPVGENDRLVGMLSDRDIVIRAVVRDVMSTDIKYVYEDESVEEVARNMSELQVRRLPVVNRDKRLVGIVSLGDLAVTEPKPAGDALKSISQPTHH
jgi:CBS domain-containing protein